MPLYALFILPDAQDYAGSVNCDSKEEAEALGARVFEAPVVAVAEGDPAPHMLPFDRPLRLSEGAP
jgi:hypothetical protein